MTSRGVTSRATGTYAVATKTGIGSMASVVGRGATGIVSEPITAGWEPMSRYNPHVSDGAPIEGPLKGYWQREIRSDGAAVTIQLSLDKPALGGETITWASDGDAIENIHWTTTSSKVVTLVRGQRSFSVVIAPKEEPTAAGSSLNKWYRERTTKLRLTATGIKIHQERGFVRLVFNSSALPPTLSLSGPTNSVDTSITFTVTASYAVQDAVTLHAEIDSSSKLFNYDIHGLRSAVIAAGETVGTFEAIKRAGTSGTDTLVIALVYERGGSLYKEMDYDGDTDTFTVQRNVHLDQNLWHQSNDISSVWQPGPAADPIRPLTPGHPSSHEGGGASSWNDLLGEATGIPQDADTKLLDPITGNELKLFHPNYNVIGGMSYIREGFEVSYTGGAITAHKILPFTMTRWYFKEMVGVDARRNAEFARVQVRHRNNNRNHGVVFRFSHKINGNSPDPVQDTAPGYKKHFDDTSVGDHFFAFTSGLEVWEYSKYNGHAESDEGWGIWYGAGEDSNGTYLWFQHYTNSNQSYAIENGTTEQPVHIGALPAGHLDRAADAGWWIIKPGKNYPDPAGSPIYREYSTEDTLETWPGAQGVASGNPIEYPIWVGFDDKSNNVKTDIGDNGEFELHFTNRLDYIRNNGIGCLMHSMQFTMSTARIDPPNTTVGRFRPCMKSAWDPQGLAVIADSGTAHKHTVSIS